MIHNKQLNDFFFLFIKKYPRWVLTRTRNSSYSNEKVVSALLILFRLSLLEKWKHINNIIIIINL